MDIMKFDTVSKDINDLTFTDYFYRLMLLARSVFKWENLPNNIDEKWIERYLFTEGKCMFFKDFEKGFMVAKCTPDGLLNPYDEWTTLRPYGTNYVVDKSYTFNEDCVVIRNNDEMIPTSFSIKLFAYRLAEISRTIDINIIAQQTPTLVTCSEKQRMSLKTVYKKWSGHEPVIYGDKTLDTSGMNVLKTDAPIVFPQLQIQKHAIWNEAMTFLGVDNANMDKRERLVDDEVQANNKQIELSAHCMLKSREKACEMINKIFKTNISVRMRTEDEMKELEQEGDEKVD